MESAPGVSQRFYYGWACVAAAALAMVATIPGRTVGLGLVTEPLLTDLSISHTTFAQINLVATLIGAVLGLAAGPLIDRFGVRAVVSGVTLLLGVVVVSMTYVRGTTGLLVAVTLTRALGQSALSVASIALVAKWFDRRVGLAMAIYSILITIGFMGAIPALEAATKHATWRVAWGTMGLVLTLVVAPLLWLVSRSSPESIGVRLDGQRSWDKQPTPPAWGYTLLGALATPAFWALAGGALVLNTAYSGITLFVVKILAERNYHGPVSLPLTVMVFIGLPTNFLTGWLAPRVAMTRLMGAAMILLAASLLLLSYLTTTPLLICFFVVFGISGGIVTVVFFACWGKLFGQRHLGKIQAVAQSITVLASAFGPLMLDGVHVRTGSYSPAFLIGAPVTAVLGAICMMIREPARQALPS
jgi:MFS family permease